MNETNRIHTHEPEESVDKTMEGEYLISNDMKYMLCNE